MLKACSLFVVALLAAGSACKESKRPESDPKVATGEPTQPAPDPAVAAAEMEAAAQDEAKKRIEENAEAMKEYEEEAAKEAQRWNEDLKKQAAALVLKKHKNAQAALKAIASSPIRAPGNSDRDKYRHPVETLTFFGIQPNMTVVEVGTGAGWYTEILAPLLAREGKLVVVSYDPGGPPEVGLTVIGKRTKLFLAKSPDVFGKVELAIINPPDKLDFGAPGSADLVIVAGEMHNWTFRGELDKYLAAIHQVLKDGGKLGVEQHRAAEGANTEETAVMGYLPQEWLIQEVEAAGLKLEARSEINANPKDTKDHEQGVWSLPPSYSEGEKDKEKYAAIGESDRMTLRFVKGSAK